MPYLFVLGNRKGVPQHVKYVRGWLLEDGYWNDQGYWDDDAFWID